MPFIKRKAARGVLSASLLIVLGGCASFTPDTGFNTVKSTVQERTGVSPRWVRGESDASEVRDAVQRSVSTGPLSADRAVEIALMNNPGLQATYAELGIAEADLVQAGRLVNLGFSFSRTRRGDEVSIERAFIANIASLITMPLRTGIERRRFEVAQFRVAADATRIAADTRRAYYSAVAAAEGVKYMDQVKEAAEASAELARRMAAAGNFSRLDHAREQLFYAETTAQLARVRQSAVSERERLTRLMGLWGGDLQFTLPERLPDLPKTARTLTELENVALKQRLDVQTAMKEAESVASSFGLTRVTGFVSVLEVSYLHNNESGRPRETGYEVELRLPIFDWGGARLKRAEYTYMQAVNRASEIAIRARSEVRESYDAYRTSFDLARHYRDEIVPLRKRISDENVLRYNGMLISVFELLADARQQVASVNTYINALRDFWVADATLQVAMTGTSPGAIGSTGGAPMAAGQAEAGGH